MTTQRRIAVFTAEVVADAVATPGGPERLAAAARATGAVAVLFGDMAARPGGDADGTLPVTVGSLPGTEPSVAALQFGLAVPDLGVLVAASSRRDAPYNLARRILSLDQLLGGRVGLVLAADPSDPAGDDAAAATASEEARLLRELWNSWPLDAIVGDSEAGVFADVSRIRAPRHGGRFDVEGPLGTPSSVQGEPVLVWDGPGTEPEADLALAELDLVVIGSLADEAEDPGVSATLREALGLTPRRLDTSAWAPAFP